MRFFGVTFRVLVTWLMIVPWIFPLVDTHWHQKMYLIGPFGMYGFSKLNVGLFDYKWSFQCNVEAIIGAGPKVVDDDEDVPKKGLANRIRTACKEFETHGAPAEGVPSEGRRLSMQELYDHACYMEESSYFFVRSCRSAALLYFGGIAAITLISISLVFLLMGSLLVVFYINWFSSPVAKRYATIMYVMAAPLQLVAVLGYVGITWDMDQLFTAPHLPGLHLAVASSGATLYYTTWMALALAGATGILPWWTVMDLQPEEELAKQMSGESAKFLWWTPEGYGAVSADVFTGEAAPPAQHGHPDAYRSDMGHPAQYGQGYAYGQGPSLA